MTFQETRKLLVALRDGLSVASAAPDHPSVVTRLRNDIDILWRRCREIWDSVGQQEEEENAHELSALRNPGRIRASHTSWDTGVSESSISNGTPSVTNPVSTKDASPDKGSSLAATIGASLAWVIPNIVVGTHSVYQTLVHAGAQVALPRYALLDGKLVVDHYAVFTSPTSITGWMPNAVFTVSPIVIPMFAATFSLAHGLDSIHACIHNRCSTRSALADVVTGGLAGGLVGSIYFSVVSLAGIGFAPIVSGSLCIGWLFTSCVILKKGTTCDFFVGMIANVAGFASFVFLSNAWLSVFASLATTAGVRVTLTWISKRWNVFLKNRLSGTARQVLGVDPSVDRAGVESAYRNLARKHHPDKNGSREYFELIHVSKEILLLDFHQHRSSPESRKPSFMDYMQLFFSSLTAPMTNPPHVQHHKLELPSDFLQSPD